MVIKVPISVTINIDFVQETTLFAKQKRFNLIGNVSISVFGKTVFDKDFQTLDGETVTNFFEYDLEVKQ